MSDARAQALTFLLAKRWDLPDHLGEFLYVMATEPGTAAHLATRLGLEVDTARTYTQRILETMKVHSKAEAVGFARSEITAALRHEDEALEIAQGLLLAGRFADARAWLAGLSAADESRALSELGAIAVHLQLAEVDGELGNQNEALAHAKYAFARATDARDEPNMAAAVVRTAILKSRVYDDATALRLIAELPSDSIKDPRLRLTRDAVEASFSWWCGIEPDIRSVRSVMRRIESGPRPAGMELALLIQGLDAARGAAQLVVRGVPSPPRRITPEEELLRRQLVSWRPQVFPSASAYANILDVLNTTKEAIVEGAGELAVRQAATRGRALAKEVGATRLAGVFDLYSPVISGA